MLTLTELFFDAVTRYDSDRALQYKRNGAYVPISHRELERRVRHVALGLGAIGIRPGDRVAILSENRPEWAIADYACLTARVADVPIYPNLPSEQLPYILNDAGVTAIFVSNAAQAAKVAAVRAAMPGLRTVIAFDPVEGVDLTLAALEARGAAADTPEAAERYRREALAVAPGDLATIIYTSGTTGEPKGVMLSHNNIYSNVVTVLASLPVIGGDDVCLSFLPLSHIFERMADYLMFAAGASICYAESIERLLDNFLEVRPTFLFSVPRIYEKIYSGAFESARAGGPIKHHLFHWARRVADRATNARLAGRSPGPLLAAQDAVAQRLVFAKLRARLGGRTRYCVSGGAPLAPEINKFFYAAGVFILEGYGLTETSPVIAVNFPDACRIGTVGKPISGVEVRIAEDGEILARGPNIMLGYYNRPDATRETIDADGWLHTGDIGEFRDNYLTITDRKKDLIKTAGGKAIAPQPIENIARQNRFVSQAVVIGDRRRFPVMLVVPNFDQLERWAREHNIAFGDHAALIEQPAVIDKMQREVLGHLGGLARFETPKKVALLEHDFTVERGELTPTLKVRRRVIDERYKTVIDALYAEPAEVAASAH